MTGANPKPDKTVPPAYPAGAIATPAAPDQAQPIWPIALAVFAAAYAAYELLRFILGILPNPKIWIEMVTGTVPFAGRTPSQWRLLSAVSLLHQLLVMGVIAPAIGLWLRRRWALWALGSWAVAALLLVLAIYTINGWVFSFSAQAWLLAVWPIILRTTWLPAILLGWIVRQRTRHQFGRWVNGALPVPLPIWAVVIGWLSMFHAVRGIIESAITLVLAAIQAVMLLNGSLEGSLFPIGVTLDTSYWIRWIWMVVPVLLLCLAQAALVVPAIALLRHRPNAARLHVIGAIIVLCSLLAKPVIAALRGVHVFPVPSVWSTVSDLIPTIYPLFLLFWFLRPRIRRQVARWQGLDAPDMIQAADERGG